VQGVTVQKQSSNIVMFLTMKSDNKDYDGLYLSNYAKLNLVDQLTRVPGVGAVNVMGAGDYSMRIWLDPAAMRIRNLSPADVYQAIQTQNVEVSAGNVGQPIGNENKNAYQYSLTVKGRLTSPEEFGNIILRTESGGRILRLRDVAHIDLGSASYSVVSQLDGKPTAAIAIYQQPGSNSLDVSTGVKAKMQELSQNFPAGVQYNVTLDTTDVIHASIDEVMVTFFETTLLVVLVIFLFLQNWRAVIIPCITIPVSLIGTLAIMSLFGFSINTLTLFGLILAVAIVVDDAIVVVENSTRLLDTGRYTARQAVTEAMGEITGPIVGVVLVLLAVFIPTMLVSGISGQLYKQFALTIAASTVLSMVGINTASNTSTTPTMGPVISPIASVTACRAVYRPVSNRRVEFSTTTMASSTTMATANISPNNVKVLIEKPNNDMIANVPISETGIVIQGMMTARQFCRKRKITSTTNSVVSKKVTITSSMDAWITSVVSSVTLYCTPAGKFCDNSCIFALTPVDTSSELLPGCW
jgi:Cu/Ag efflux pump CusA